MSDFCSYCSPTTCGSHAPDCPHFTPNYAPYVYQDHTPSLHLPTANLEQLVEIAAHNPFAQTALSNYLAGKTDWPTTLTGCIAALDQAYCALLQAYITLLKRVPVPTETMELPHVPR